jgi:hypothetical protein
MRRATALVRFEQAVYGSFPFWDRGYAVLAQSPGCRPEWLEGLRAACQRLGERPRDAAGAGGLFALRLGDGTRMIVGMADLGADDRGRPGALAFHALFLKARDDRRAGYDPFALAGALRRDWGPQARSLPAGTWPVAADEARSGPGDERAGPIASALARGRRVALEAAGPIDALARDVWRTLPARVRRRATVATWAFANGNRFDLLAVPRLAAIELDASYVDPAALDTGKGPGPGPRRWGRLALAGGSLALLAGALGLALGRGGDARPLPQVAPAVRVEAPRPIDRDRPPDPAAFPDDRLAPGERQLVAEGLADLADRFGVATGGDGPTALMARLAGRLRYRGPLLTAGERSRLAVEPGPDAARALAWDARVRRFVADRPLPGGFERGPLRWQLASLAWSFHVAPDPRRPAAEVPYDLADALARDGEVRPSPLAAQYPVLDDYARFLAHLPRR